MLLLLLLLLLSFGQTIPTCQRSISHNIVGRSMLRAFNHCVAMCCDMSGVVASSLKMVKFEPTTPSTSQQGGQTHTTCCVQQCCDMLRWHACCDRLAGALESIAHCTDSPRGVLPEKSGGGVRPASQNPYPIYDQNLRFSLPYLWPDQKSDTLFMTLQLTQLP